MKKINYPSMRVYVIEALEMLSNEYIRAEKLPPPVKWHPFDHPVHVLFDDTILAEDPERAIGDILFNKEEAEAIKIVVKKIDEMLNIIGDYPDDEIYYQSPYWQGIYESSKKALEIMNKTPFDVETGIEKDE
jgi:hypothetical protein